MKVFAWRACQEKLPTYLNLKKKHVLDNATCVLCNQEVRNVWGVFCSQMDNKQSELFVVITWGLWYRRNKRIYENISMHFNVRLFDVSNQKINKVVRWHPPPNDFLKLNIDGATFLEYSVVGIGVVLRDHNGEVVVACSKVEKEVSSAEFIEAIALLREVKVVHVNRLGNLVAHLLARHAWLIDDICMWWDYCPSFVSQTIWLDKLAICKDI
ncbi:hypothetical protein I3760_04G141500 [Carya illinoinensis]|nr:hypothetical protein I3760_04G141500 [Carya illinoinensis]